MITKKRGQVTIFIIMGMILLIGAAVIMYITSLQQEETKAQTEITTVEIPTWAQPVNNYVEGCIQTIAIEGFKKLGERGGYIDLNDDELSGRSFNIDDDPTESDAVKLSKNDPAPVAYWWYLETENNCADCNMDSMIPTVEEIEEQMNRYIERKLVGCINDFAIFKEQGFEFNIGEVKTDTSIEYDDIDLFVNYPTEIKKQGSETSIEDFHIELDLKLREILELAFLLTLDQINNQVQEDILLHLINLYSGVDSDKIPPIFDIDYEKTTATWELDDVNERIRKYILGSNIPLIQVDKTRDATHLTNNDPLTQGAYDIMYLDFLSTDYQDLEYPNLKVNFFFNPLWDIYLYITPISGTTLSPKTDVTEYPLGILPSKNTNYYSFFYDISYPVIVTIRDDYSLTKYGELGYTFRFALEGNIRDNKDLLQWNQGEGTIGEVTYENVEISWTLTNQSPGNCTESNNQYTCSIDGAQYSDIAACIQNCYEQTTISSEDDENQYVQSLFCNPNQRISKNITVKVSDEDKNPVEDASVSYKCGNYRSCSIGPTDENGVYIGKFPMCMGDGFLTVEKSGYLTTIKDGISIDLTHEKTIKVEMEKLKQIEVEIVYINITNLYRIHRYLTDNWGEIETTIGKIEDSIVSFECTGLGCPSDYELDEDEVNSILSDFHSAENELTNAKNTLDDIEYSYQLNETTRSKVVTPTKNIKEALESVYEFAYDLKTQPDYVDNIINRDFKGDITIDDNTLTKLEDYSTILNKELENIQFVSDYDLVTGKYLNHYRNTAEPIDEYDEVIVSIQKEKEDDYEQNIPMPSALVTYEEAGNISIVPGTYSVTITAQDEVGYIIPAENLVPSGIGDISSYAEMVDIDVPDEIDTLEDMEYTYIGGTQLNNETGEWIITDNDLENTNKVTFYVLRIDRVEYIEDIGETGKIEEYSDRYRAYIEPEFLP